MHLDEPLSEYLLIAVLFTLYVAGVPLVLAGLGIGAAWLLGARGMDWGTWLIVAFLILPWWVLMAAGSGHRGRG